MLANTRQSLRNTFFATAATALLLLLAALLTAQTAHAATSTVDMTKVAETLNANAARTKAVRGVAVQAALAQIGDTYKRGAVGPDAFDCSGLTSFAWNEAGVKIPRTSTAQREWTLLVDQNRMLGGDLLFYTGHVTMYVGYAQGTYWMMEAPGVGKPVRLTPIRTKGLLKVGRVH
jgi:cell wall-associated NlpC family hydrolase